MHNLESGNGTPGVGSVAPGPYLFGGAKAQLADKVYGIYQQMGDCWQSKGLNEWTDRQGWVVHPSYIMG